LGKYSKNVAGFAWQSDDPLPARITGLRMVMQQALGSERCCETVEKSYSAGDQKHQEHEYDGVDLHAFTVIIEQPQIVGRFFRRSQRGQVRRRMQSPSISVPSQINNI